MSTSLTTSPVPHVEARRRRSWIGERETLSVLALSVAWFALLAGLRPLNLPDEGRYVGVAWEILSSGASWGTPTLDGLPFFHKPPLFYWLSAASMQVLGASPWAARLPVTVAAAIAVAILFSAAREWFGAATARRAALVLSTMPLWFAAAQFGNMDLLVAATISATILLSARAVLRFEEAGAWRRLMLGAAVAAGLGVLAKGLIGAVLPGLVLTTWLVLRRRWSSFRPLLWAPVIVTFLAVVAPWLLLEEQRHPGFLHYFIVVQHFHRYSGTGFNNAAPFWFYVPVLLVLTLPWSFWLLRRLAGYLRSAEGRTAVVPLLWSWPLVIVAFFSIPQSKLIGYAIPCVVPMAILVALLLPKAPDRTRLTAALAAALCAGLIVAATLARPNSSASLAAALVDHGGRDQALAFVDDYWYDIPVYAHRHAPVEVVARWDDPAIEAGDDWRKELTDAAKFAPALAAERLRTESQLKDAMCAGRIQWVVISPAALPRYRYLQGTELVASVGKGELRRVRAEDGLQRSLLGCASGS